MGFHEISVAEYKEHPISLWSEKWLLLACGDFQKEFNVMTVAWGSIGYIWNQAFVQIFVRPTRYTFQFCERYETFTLSSFPERYRPALNLLGTKSGRDSDKLKESGLTPILSRYVGAPSFAEAQLSFECKKIYSDDIDPEKFLDANIEKHYGKKDFHRFFFGSIKGIFLAEIP